MDHVLVMNLGDPWTDPSQLQLFDNRVVDMACGKHVAPGSDLIPLDILFTICSSMHSWLKVNDKNVTFLHANNTATGSGEDSLKFVVGCYLAYLGDSDKTTHLSPSQQKPSDGHWNVHDKAFMAPQESESDVSQVMYSIGLDTNKIESYGGPARKRYAQYFLSILYTPNPPPSQENLLVVDNVTITGLDEIRTNLRVNRILSQRWRDSLLHPVLVIYQGGKLKWKQVVPIKDSRVDVSPEVTVRGDSVVGLWFVKDCISTNDPPVVAFSFHSAFMAAGVVRLSSGDLTCMGMDMQQMLDNPVCNVTMELVLTYGESSDEEEEVPNISWSEYRNRWLAQRGGLPDVYATVQDCQRKEGPSRKTWSQRKPRRAMDLARQKVEEVVTEPPEIEIPPIKAEPKEPSREEQDSMEAPATPPATPLASEVMLPRTPSPQPTPPISDEVVKRKDSTETAASVEKTKNSKSSPAKKKSGPAPPPPPPPPRRKKGRSSTLSPSPSMKARMLSKTKCFFWDIAPKQSGTVWSELTQSELDASRLSMLETLFGNEDISKSVESAKSKASTMKKPGSAMALSVGRANNVSIMMTRFKHFAGIDEICKSVLCGEGMTDEELGLLAQIGPTEGEINDLKEHKEEDLSVPEKILLGMTVIPRLRTKASCRLAMRNWERNYSEAIEMLETIKVTCQQLKESKRLQRVFTAVLSVGNTMNKGTSRGNAGCIKLESLSRLWDTRVSGGSVQAQAANSAPLQRAGSVPTAISQALEGPRVEEQIVTLLDFTAVIVHDKEVAHGSGSLCDSYLLMELESLPDSVKYLEDGVEDLLAEVDRGFELLEMEFRDMTGKPWGTVDSSKLDAIKIRNCDRLVEEQRLFLRHGHQFLMQAGGARNFLKQEENVVDQHLKSAVQWLGEASSDNPKMHLKRLLEFAKRFDRSYHQLKECLVPIPE